MISKEKKYWENKGYDIYQNRKYDSLNISDYEFCILERYNLKNKNILEIGPGLGRDIKKFSKLGAKLNAIDISAKFIADIKKKFKGNFEVMDLRNIDKWKHEKIDLIYSRWSLLSLNYSEFKNFLLKSTRILNNNGKILISLRAGESLSNIHKNTNMQSIQINNKNLLKALAPNTEIVFFEIIPFVSSENSNDFQVTFIINNGILKNSKDPYLK